MLRQRREREFSVVAEALLIPPEISATMPAPEDAPRAGEVLPLATLVASDVPEDARILSVNGRRVTVRTASWALRRARPPFLLHVQHDSTRFFAAIEPGP